MKFPAWKLFKMMPKLLTGDAKAIAEFVVLLLMWATTKTENDWDDRMVQKVRKALESKP